MEDNDDDTKQGTAKPGTHDIWPCLKTAMASLECGKAFRFDTRGDLVLKVGNGIAYEFVVCSRTIARWSSVFRAMLFSGFAESEPTGSTWIVDLPEDQPSPLFIILSIAHGYFENVPKSLSQNHLYQVLVVTEKYDMTKILRPYAATWFEPYKRVGDIEGSEIRLWISWELGHEKTFSRLARLLFMESRTNKDGELVDSEGVPLTSYNCLEPPGIIGKLKFSQDR
ncbi:hypothetical protein CkaCkLH20_08871 [Colletotrichum karsti]|uniref:BTB domain-containing protein n=1 Tax=Colletotrichum karsti TaxID=1095194 RepID=A0A9P6I2I3_9PEZI|nr:uncharacterized protein CkaCkLH20_08871 [Colletotrichum karsti]KAF9873761.1 hypothetical protein CkaCkLH20_08871 [Colletotrichum karsti]